MRNLDGVILILLFASASLVPAHSQQDVDLIVSGGTVVTMDAEFRVIEDGAVAIEGDTIVAVGARSDIAPAREPPGRSMQAVRSSRPE